MSGTDQPTVYMIAGPNGAGKSTAAMRLLPDFLSVREFVNADAIAAGLNPLDPAGQAIAAGRIMLERFRQLIIGGITFAFETTGASLLFVKWLQKAKNAGYQFHLIYLWLPSPEFAVERVRLRVRQGGHAISDDIIKRRFGRSLENLVRYYMALADVVEIYDGSVPALVERRLIARKGLGRWAIYNEGLWSMIHNAGISHE